MKQIFIIAAMFVSCLGVIQAQTKNDKLIEEINALRSNLIKTINKRDRQTLEEIYADDFTHTHASGQVDDKRKRIAALVSGDLTIESAAVNEINIRIYSKNTAIAVGQSTITNVQQKTTKYRWTIVYVKLKHRWRIAASQATQLQ